MMALFDGDPSRAVITRELSLSSTVVNALAGGGIELITQAMRPYGLQVKAGPEGTRVKGHLAAVDLFVKLMGELETSAGDGVSLDSNALAEMLRAFLEHQLKFDLAFRLEGLPHAVRPLNLTQVAFMNALLDDPHQLILGIGPTGTGKTHLAIAAGLSLLAAGKVQHLIVTRPLVLWEGEVMTAPRRADIVNEGQFTAIDDELHDLIGYEASQRLIAEGRLELVPLGCLRGRTFNQSYIVVDEAQNLLSHQMRMVLTRLGRGSRMVVLGDPEQIDLHGDELSGLPDFLHRLEGGDLALVHRFRRSEIVRNPLVADIEALFDDDAGMPAQRAA